MPKKTTSPASAGAPSGFIRVAVWGSAVLAVLAAAAFYFAADRAQNRKPALDGAIVVTITGRNCDPDTLTVPAGRTTFQIINRSDRAVEWEILDGVMVVEERENIAPGFTQSLTAKLAPGDYAITCGLLGNPRGVLHVTPSKQAAAEAARPAPRAYIGALAEYRVYLTIEAGKLNRAVGELATAIKAGDLPKARTLYASSHLIYTHIGPVTDMFADLDQRINARANDFEQREQDPAFTGFHRIEYALFKQNSAQGLDSIANQLVADVGALQARIRALKIPPERMAHGAVRALNKASSFLASDSQHASGDVAVSDMKGTLEGVNELVGLLRPLLAKADAALLTRIDADFKTLSAALNTDRSAPGSGAGKTLAGQFKALAADVAAINPALGLN